MLLVACSNESNEYVQDDCDSLTDNIAYKFCGADGVFITKNDALNTDDCQHAFGSLISHCYERTMKSD